MINNLRKNIKIMIRKRNNKRALYESIMKDVAKKVKKHLNEDTEQTKNVQYKYFPKDFDELQSLIEQLLEERGKDANLNDINVSNITDMYGLFSGLEPHNIDISEWDVSKVEDMSYMFDDCKKFNCDLSNWDVRQVKDMENMFSGCWNFTGEGLENWEPINCKDMNCMFNTCKNFNCDLSNWDVRQVKDMQFMFEGCDNFTGEGLENWEPINCKNMKYMFDECDSLKNTPIWYRK